MITELLCYAQNQFRCSIRRQTILTNTLAEIIIYIHTIDNVHAITHVPNVHATARALLFRWNRNVVTAMCRAFIAYRSRNYTLNSKLTVYPRNTNALIDNLRPLSNATFD